ncbi:uncharacterized protein LOC135498023 [Lineus longissimus]|uniref:uncharacterized protein LOC135498023 n=1 Tax=Lineus longissimus TaxID=88925 RepID=UPI002B4C9E4B
MKCAHGFYLESRPGSPPGSCEPCDKVCHPAFLNCSIEYCQEYWNQMYVLLTETPTDPPSSSRAVKNGLAIGLGVTVAVLVIITIIVIGVYYLKKRRKKPSKSPSSMELKNQAYMVLKKPEDEFGEEKQVSVGQAKGHVPHKARGRLESGESEKGETYDLDDILDVIGD